MNTSDPTLDHQLLKDFALTSNSVEKEYPAHWSDRYARVMMMTLIYHYGNPSKVGYNTNISASLISQVLNNRRYHISTSTLARLEETIDIVLEEVDHAKASR